MMMRQRIQCRVRDHRQVRQLDLFGEQAPIMADRPAPAWQVLPEETRQILTGLMLRLLLDHDGFEHRPSRTEAADDV
jgi:hypothetical protein